MSDLENVLQKQGVNVLNLAIEKIEKGNMLIQSISIDNNEAITHQLGNMSTTRRTMTIELEYYDTFLEGFDDKRKS